MIPAMTDNTGYYPPTRGWGERVNNLIAPSDRHRGKRCGKTCNVYPYFRAHFPQHGV